MKPFIQIALDTGHVFELATSVIAQNRAKCMQEMHPDEFKTIDEALADTVELFDDAYEVSDWAKSNMNPEDYMPSARLLRFTPPGQDFSNAAEWTMHDLPGLMGELSGEDIMRQPVEAVLTTMAASQQLCNITILNNSDGKPYAAVALILGNENAIDAYVRGMSFIGNKLTGEQPAAVVH